MGVVDLAVLMKRGAFDKVFLDFLAQCPRQLASADALVDR
jgi:hypothetical protein